MVYRCNRVGYRRESRKDRGACTFSYFSESSQQAHKIEIPYEIQQSIELTQEPVSLGDHLRCRRHELGLYQKDVAVQIGVTTSTIWNWENGWSSIALGYIPKIITFLGYNPLPRPGGLMERLAWYKQVKGLTLEQLSAEMGRDPEQLADWLGGRHIPCQRNREEVQLFLSGRVQKL